MRDRILEVMAEVFDVPVGDVPPDASIESIEPWDSLHHFALMLELETRFGVQISSDDMPLLLSVNAIEDYIDGQQLAPPA